MAKQSSVKPSGKSKIKDAIIIFIFCFFVALEIYSHVTGSTNSGISASAILELISPIAVSYVGLIEIFRFLEWDIFVPDFMLRKQKQDRMEDIEQCMKAYFQNEANFIHDYSEEKIGYLLTQLNISTNQLDKIRLNLIEMRCIPLRTMDDAQRKIIEYIKCDEEPMVIHQDHVDSSKLTHGQVKYFVNFIDSMFLPGYCSEISSVLAFLIKSNVEIESFDKIIIPHDSNFMLGVEVGKRLGRPVVKMRYEKGRVVQAQCWDGDLKRTDKVIIVHDVLVTADQIVHVIEKIPNTCHVVGLFCLLERKEWGGHEKLKKKGVSVTSLLSVEDNDVKAIMEGNYVPIEQRWTSKLPKCLKRDRDD